MEDRLLVAELHGYLVLLSSLPGSAGETDAANQVLHVSKFVSGSTSELYGEARLLLPRILQSKGGKLSASDRARLQEIIAGIEMELWRVGGA